MTAVDTARRNPGGRLAALLAVPLAALAIAAAPQSATNLAAGRLSYESKCGGCHSLDMNRIGPSHRGVVGRVPGSVPGYAYSPAVKRLGGVWSTARLDLWLQNTQKVAPGSKMYFSVADPAERRNIIAYLQSVSPPVQRH